MGWPVLRTERLELRRPTPEDFEAFAAFCALERSKWVGGPADRADAWEGFALDLGHWEMRGYGYFFAFLDGAAIGRIGLRRTECRPETELAFSLFDGAYEGKGLAYEAAVVVRDHGWQDQHLASLVSYIDPANTRSVALAERLGASPDHTAPKWGKHNQLRVYRHPKPEVAA